MSGHVTFSNPASALSGLERMRETIAGLREGPAIWAKLGLKLVAVDEGTAQLVATPDASVCNPNGSVHGGWYGTILDSCMASAVSSTLAAGIGSTTLEFKVNIIRPIPAGMTVRATGVIQHSGRSTGIAAGELRDEATGKLHATGSTTCMIFPLPPA